MNGVIILKRLRQSELGLFKPVRRQGRETARQRGLNFDRPIVDEVFGPPSSIAEIRLRTRYFDGHTVVEDSRPLKKQQKNWRLTGDAIDGAAFERVAEGDLVLMHVLPPAGSGQPTSLTFDVLGGSDRRTHAIYGLVRDVLGSDAMCIVEEETAQRFMRLAARRLPAFGGDLAFDTGDLTDDDFDEAATWLSTWLSVAKRKQLAGICKVVGADEVALAAGVRQKRRAVDADIPEILRRYGSDLLADSERRHLLASARFSRAAERPELSRWHPGKSAAIHFVRQLELPAVFAGTVNTKPPDQEDIDAFPVLGELHEYQVSLAAQIDATLAAPRWNDRRGIVWLPTGTGKTRVMVETLVRRCRLEAPRNCILWIADRGELCDQAVETFRHVWQVLGRESGAVRSGAPPSLRVIRLWGGRPFQEPPTGPTVIVASIQTLAQRIADEEFREELAILGQRSDAIVFDEAHHVVADSWVRIIRDLGLSRTSNYLGYNRQTAPPLFGLTATPARSSDDETERLRARFEGRLLEPDEPFLSLDAFQASGYLARPTNICIDTGYRVFLRWGEQQQYATFRSLPGSVLERVGEDVDRTALIVKDLIERAKTYQSILVFAASVHQAHVIADVLQQAGVRAAAVDGSTPRALRWNAIQRFRSGRISVLVNNDLLATGFDAPNIDAVALARPVESRVLYAQMVGRGLRGPRNGGTETCAVLDYMDRIPQLGDLDMLRHDFRRMFLGGHP